ncbi:MAG: hypothetical protein V7L02_04210, partial [Nostoc sp.]
MILTQLEKFRQAIYDCLGKAKDAVFELMDAVLTSPSIPSFVSLSQSPVFRRQWSSVYAALHGTNTCAVLPWSIGIDLQSRGYIGHSLNLALL